MARHALNVSVMKAPFGGVIASKNAEVGDVINPMMGGFRPAAGGVLTLVDFSRVKIVVEALQRHRPPAQRPEGGPSNPALPGRDFEGTVPGRQHGRRRLDQEVPVEIAPTTRTWCYAWDVRHVIIRGQHARERLGHSPKGRSGRQVRLRGRGGKAVNGKSPSGFRTRPSSRS